MHSPFICLSNGNGAEESNQAPRSANLRRNLRKAMRKIDGEGGLKVYHSTRAETGLIQRLFELEASGWKGRKGSAVLSCERETIFWNTIIRSAEKAGYLAIVALEFKGKIVAVQLGVRYKGRFYGMKQGVDEQLKAYSLGHLLVAVILDSCQHNRLSEYHLMGLRSGWKDQWTNHLQAHAMCYIFKNGVYGYIVKNAVLRNIALRKKTFVSGQERLEN
jgi:CelD/BcsL family acetyltransferase involved in cellulose biosynthesis